MTDEVKEVVYIAIATILLGIILSYVALMGTLKRDMAKVRNNEVAGTNNIIQYNKYAKYNRNELVGEEVIECIRAYYDTGIDIYVGSDRISHHLFNLNEYLNGKSQYFVFSENIDGSKSYLQQWFTSSDTYRAYLIYNSEDIQMAYDRIMRKYGAPKGDSVSKQVKYAKLDSCVGEPIQNSEVTGILIIDTRLL